MPRVNTVEKARKADPRYGIAVGDKYYWWTFKNQRGPGTKMKSKTYPKPSQLTRSNFKSQWRGFAEQMQDLALDDGLHDALQEIAGAIRELGEECQSSLDNMPEGLQQGSTGEMLQERIDACDNWAGEIEGLDQPEREDPEHQTFEEFLDEYMAREGAEQPGEMADLIEWATDLWDDHKRECQEREDEADTNFQSALEDLRDEAINADPGEV